MRFFHSSMHKKYVQMLFCAQQEKKIERPVKLFYQLSHMYAPGKY